MKSVLLITLIWLFSINVFAAEIVGRVVAVADGDTLTLIDATNITYKVRLLGIDAPEKSQPFGTKSKQSLAAMVFNKTVLIEYIKQDKYKRIVGKVLLDYKDINLEQIKRGLAWHYKKYENEQAPIDRRAYANHEYAAKHEKRGLWSDKNPIAPWVFRKKGVVTLENDDIELEKTIP